MADCSCMESLHKVIPSFQELSELISQLHCVANYSKSTWLRIVLLFTCLIFLTYTFTIYPVFLCNIRHVPGPYVSKVTSLWLTYQGYKNNGNQYIHRLHNKYGPVVRVAPCIVSFNSVDAIPAIYGVRSNFPKPSSAANLDNYGKPNTFSSVSNEDHRRRRGRYASSYSKSYMTQGSGYDGIVRRTGRVLANIDNAVRTMESIDIYKLFHYYAIDNVSVISSGTTLGLLDGQNTGYSQDLRDMFMGFAYIFYFPIVSMLIRAAPVAPFHLIPGRLLNALQAHSRVQEKNLEHYQRSCSVGQPEFEKAVLVRLQEHKDYGSPDLTDMHVASEISDHLLAGADTLVAGLVYTFWELAQPQNKAHLDKLFEEIKTIDYDASGRPASYTALDGLVWLNCCIREGLRLHTPSGHMQSRLVPEGGAMITGYMIPEMTEVGIPLYSMQLNPAIFKDPYSFKPDRWLEENSEPDGLQKMRLAWMTFGHGARICVGKELALVQVKLMLALVLRKYSITVDNTQSEDEMEGLQMAVLTPKGGRCLLKFSDRRSEKLKIF